MIKAAKPQPSAAEELRKLKKIGRLHAAAVVKFAADPDTALHEFFEWDDSAAAQKYRLEQARHLIRAQVIVLPQDNEPIRAFVHLHNDKDSGGGYRETKVVLESEELHKQWLGQAFDEFESWRKKYKRLKELDPVFDAANRVKAKVSKNGSSKLQRKAKSK